MKSRDRLNQIIPEFRRNGWRSSCLPVRIEQIHTPMNDYKEFTFGWLIFIVVVPIHLLFTFLHIHGIGDRPIGTYGYSAMTLTFVLICALFYGLTTNITSDTITVSFGIGLIRKRIPLKRIKAVKTVTSPWYYGWGIRLIPNGILFNISGTDGVELKFHDTGRIIRIGSKDSLALKREIEKRLA